MLVKRLPIVGEPLLDRGNQRIECGGPRSPGRGGTGEKSSGARYLRTVLRSMAKLCAIALGPKP